MIDPRLVLSSALMLTCAVASAAGVYRWVDTEGHVHYTDKAVPNSEPVNVHTGHVQERTSAEAPGAPNAAQLTQLKSSCDQKKSQYESYKSAVKIVETDQLGRKHEYSAEDQKMLIDKAQKDMQDACAAAGVTITSESSSTPQ